MGVGGFLFERKETRESFSSLVFNSRKKAQEAKKYSYGNLNKYQFLTAKRHERTRNIKPQEVG
jgi:hypothetical protein